MAVGIVDSIVAVVVVVVVVVAVVVVVVRGRVRVGGNWRLGGRSGGCGGRNGRFPLAGLACGVSMIVGGVGLGMGVVVVVGGEGTVGSRVGVGTGVLRRGVGVRFEGGAERQEEDREEERHLEEGQMEGGQGELLGEEPARRRRVGDIVELGEVFEEAFRAFVVALRPLAVAFHNHKEV